MERRHSSRHGMAKRERSCCFWCVNKFLLVRLETRLQESKSGQSLRLFTRVKEERKELRKSRTSPSHLLVSFLHFCLLLFHDIRHTKWTRDLFSLWQSLNIHSVMLNWQAGDRTACEVEWESNLEWTQKDAEDGRMTKMCLKESQEVREKEEKKRKGMMEHGDGVKRRGHTKLRCMSSSEGNLHVWDS